MLFQPTKLIRCFTLGLAISMVGVSTGFADISYSDLSVELQAQAKAIMVEGDPPKARNLLVQALTADPSNASAYIQLGRLNMLEEKFEEAARLMKIALEIEPSSRQANLWRGQSELQLDNLENAQNALEQLENLCADCSEKRELERAIADKRVALDRPSSEKAAAAKNASDTSTPPAEK